MNNTENEYINKRFTTTLILKHCAQLIQLLVLFIIFSNNIYAEVADQKFDEKINNANYFNDERPLKIAMIKNYPPLSMLLPNGQPTGYYVDLWKLWSKITGVPIKIVPQEYYQNMEAIKSKQVDMLAGLFINQDRKRWADFSIPITRVRSAVYFSSDRLDRPRLANMNGQRIAVPRGTYQEFFIRNKYPEIQVISFDNSKEAILNLVNGKIDAIVGELPYMNAQMGILGMQGSMEIGEEIILENTAHGMILKSNSSLLRLINQGLRSIPIDQLLALENKWIPGESAYFDNVINKNVPSLTIAEKEWVALHPEIILGVSPKLLPFESLDEDGEFSGISSDYIRLIEKKLAVKFLPQENVTWSEVMALTKQKQIDVLPAVVSTTERKEYLNFTKDYMSVPLIIATNIDTPLINGLTDLDGMVVGVEESTPPESILKKRYPKVKLKIFQSAKEALIDLQNKNIDALVHNLATTTYLLNHESITDIQIAAFTSHELKISMGVRKGLEPLEKILDKTLLTIDDKARQSITNKWISIQVDFATQLKTLVIWLLPLTSLMFAIIFFVVKTNRKLQSEVETRKQKEEYLEETKLEAEKASGVKDRFLANMSHELRTPMSAIIGMSQLFEQTTISASQKEHIDTISESANSLLELINDILDLSKIQAGKMELESIKFNFDSLFDTVKKHMNFADDDAKINATDDVEHIINIMDGIPQNLIGDSLRLAQVLSHIIENAKKFTEQGKIELSISSTNIDPNMVELHFIIADSGIGMSDEQVSNLFDVYNQVDASSTRKYEGIGIGLSLCKEICKLMNGELWLTSQLGVGSIFHFTVKLIVDKSAANESLPNKLPRNLSSNEAEEKSLDGKKVLVVDDNITNRLVAGKMLERANVEVFMAKNGVECLLILSENNFDAILMDIQMPVMDGYTATKKIRENAKHTELPIIGLSANITRSDVENALAAGMNQYLGKPVSSKILLETLRKHI